MKDLYTSLTVEVVSPSFMPVALRAAADAIERDTVCQDMTIKKGDPPLYTVQISRGDLIADVQYKLLDLVEYYSDTQNGKVPPQVAEVLYQLRIMLEPLEATP
ncbi:hypothetical protein [Halomonas korlensis]|uniref:Uncharacterized protein n=1 Tax=Halomonas korlensis TaxID=463301 RepID=A0A1I7KM15_9GAMM|nr:hypothetical protein [Halomonas korlensis]SFU98451.1 hypothetical protein SAMN04487955_1268 [Halomonas korlensis]